MLPILCSHIRTINNNFHLIVKKETKTRMKNLFFSKQQFIFLYTNTIYKKQQKQMLKDNVQDVLFERIIV